MFPVIGIFLLMACNPTFDKNHLTASPNQRIIGDTQDMPTFVIEREMPSAGNLTTEELKGASQASCTVLNAMGPDIRWLHSYVTENKVYCIYKARNNQRTCAKIRHLFYIVYTIVKTMGSPRRSIPSFYHAIKLSLSAEAMALPSNMPTIQDSGFNTVNKF
jgi:hypothetical protein